MSASFHWKPIGVPVSRIMARHDSMAELTRFEEVQYTDIKSRHEMIGQFRFEFPRSFQYVMDLRLRNPQYPGKTSFAEIAILYTEIYKLYKS
jgi:hypothetical protein